VALAVASRKERSRRGRRVRRSALPAAGEIHVWSAELDRPPAFVDQCAGHLAADELARAARYRFRLHRDRYAVGRGLLRLLLGRYLDCSPNEVRFRYDQHGKPALDEASSGLSFNVSHSESLGLYAFCVGSEIGVDVERMRTEVSREQVAEHFFSPTEIATLRALPYDLQPSAFLACWTRKEAFLKARGDGLTLPLDGFDVTLAPGDVPALTRTAWAPGEAAMWTLYDVSAWLEDHQAAVAVRRGTWTFVFDDALCESTEVTSSFGKEHSS
jgi:4'-phosphopantetheinyl transferase